MITCPIFFQIIKESLIGIDNFTYENADIVKWLNKSNTFPNTREGMYEYNMRQDITMKKVIRFV